MKQSIKSIAVLMIVILLGLAVAPNAGAGPNRGNVHAQRQIEACIAEINKRANYVDAAKVVHWIVSLEQKNLVEMTIGVETMAYTRDGETPLAGYAASCVTGALGGLVKFRIELLDVHMSKRNTGLKL